VPIKAREGLLITDADRDRLYTLPTKTKPNQSSWFALQLWPFGSGGDQMQRYLYTLTAAMGGHELVYVGTLCGPAVRPCVAAAAAPMMHELSARRKLGRCHLSSPDVLVSSVRAFVHPLTPPPAHSAPSFTHQRFVPLCRDVTGELSAFATLCCVVTSISISCPTAGHTHLVHYVRVHHVTTVTMKPIKGSLPFGGL
jgi:hypothetical protein